MTIDERTEWQRQCEEALGHIRTEIAHQRDLLKEFNEVIVPEFRGSGLQGQLLEGFSDSIRKYEIVERTLAQLLAQCEVSNGQETNNMWEDTAEPDRSALVPDENNLDADAAVRGNLWINRSTGEHYLEGIVGGDAGKWFRLVGFIYFRCPDHPETEYVNTNLRISAAQWTRVGPVGNSVTCYACPKTHALTKENTKFVPA